MKAKKIKKYLEERGLKQCRVAGENQIEHAQFNRWVNGYAPLPAKKIGAVAKYLDLSEEEVSRGLVFEKGTSK